MTAGIHTLRDRPGNNALRYQFDGFELDTGLMELHTSGGIRVPMEPQVYDVLVYLVEHRDRLVPKDELLDHVWPEKYVTEAALNSRLAGARKAIGDNGRDQRLIRTQHGRGYRFTGAVEILSDAASPGAGSGPAPVQHPIRFCTAADGTRIAYTRSEGGPPLVKSANWLTHLELDAANPVWRHVWNDLARDFSLVRYDARGSGLSDWDVDRFSFEAWVEDLEAVVDAVGLERFPLLGMSQGGAVAIAYTVRHPERVSHLVLLGAYARGRLERQSEGWAARHDAMRTIIGQSWGRDSDAFREIFSLTMAPDGTREHWQWLTDLQRVSASTENALRFYETTGRINVEALLPEISAPTLVLHARGDQRVPFDEGRNLAAQIRNARFVTLESRNHLLVDGEPAWLRCREEIRAFLADGGGTAGDNRDNGHLDAPPARL